MAIQFLNTVDLNFNQLDKAVIQNIGTDPAVGVLGQIYFDSSNAVKKLKVCTAASTIGPVVAAVWTVVGSDASDATITLTAGTGLTDGGTFTLNQAANKTITFNLDYSGTDNFILGAATPSGTITDQFLLAATDTGNVVRKITIANIVALAPQGTGDVTEVKASTADAELGIKVTAPTGPIPIVGLDINGLPTSGVPADTASVTFAAYDGDATDKNVQITIEALLAAAPAGTLTGIDPGTYISIDDAATATPKVNALGTEAATASKLVARNAGGFGFVETAASGSNDTTIATTAFVQGALTGLLEFKGGFLGSTGAIDPAPSPATFLYQLTGGSFDPSKDRLAIAVGDYYVVTLAGNFFGNASTPLTPGDSVIAQKAVAANTSVESDFIVVQSDTDLATASTVGIGNVEGTANQIGVTYSSGTGTITNLDRGSSQNIFKTITAPAGGDVVAASNSDTLNFTASGGMTITNTPGSNTVDFSSANTNTEYTAGTGLTLNTLEFDVNVNATAQTVAANAVTTTAARTYAVQVDSSDDLVVNVPWADTDTGALGKRVILNTTLGYVAAGDNGGVRMFSIKVDNSNVFGTGVIARNVKCEVIDARTTPAGVAGQTVYADITRGVDGTAGTFGTASLNISFTGTPAVDGTAYEVLLTYVG